MTKVRLPELRDAMEFVSASDLVECFAYIDMETGRVIEFSEEFEPEDEELPDDVKTNDRYLAVPTRQDLDLGRALLLSFVEEHLPSDLERAKQYFRSKGAYRRCKDMIDARGRMGEWYAFEATAVDEALQRWSGANGIEVVD